MQRRESGKVVFASRNERNTSRRERALERRTKELAFLRSEESTETKLRKFGYDTVLPREWNTIGAEMILNQKIDCAEMDISNLNKRLTKQVQPSIPI